MPLELRRDVPLAPFTTFELGGAARFFVEVGDEAALGEALSFARERALPVAVLGGGSNLVVADGGFPGVVIRIALRGVTPRTMGNRSELVVAAGEPWDALVARTVEDDLAGFECLAGIPGLAGATPIQNVGAYGQEVGEAIVRVRTIDRATGEVRERSGAECRFRYRSSIFKHAPAASEIVTSVTFALTRGGAPAVRYPELEKAIRDAGDDVTLANVRATVLRLRRGKSMVLDPADDNRRSAGSFFTNPIVTAAQADAAAARAIALGIIDDPKTMPRFAAEAEDGSARVKLAAGWLIERAGFARGLRRGAVGISSRHALALVHHGGGTTAALVDLAREIVAGVEQRFGIRLHPEPVFLGFGDEGPLALT